MTPNRKQPPIRDSPYAKQPGKKKKTDIQLSGIHQLDAQFANLDIGDSDPPTDDQEHALGILAAATEVLLEWNQILMTSLILLRRTIISTKFSNSNSSITARLPSSPLPAARRGRCDDYRDMESRSQQSSVGAEEDR